MSAMNAVDKLAQQAAAAVDTEWVVSLTQELVRIRSVYEPAGGSNESKAARFVAKVLEGMGLKPISEEAAPGRPNIICDWQGSAFDPTRHKTLMFEGHTDVVTEGNADKWTYPPFAAKIVNERIYGRGAADMKAGVAAAICALKAVMSIAPDLAGRIRLGIVADEEGMMLGIKDFITKGWAKDVSGAIICEPEENEICLFQKGALRLAVHISGVMSHGAMPYAGVNPIPSLAALVIEAKELEQREQQRLGAHDYLGLPWITPTIVSAPASGEAQVNVVPESAYLTFDIRTVPGQDHQALLREFETIAQKLAAQNEGVQIRLELIEERPWTETPANDPLVTAVEKASNLILGTRRYGGVPGATDGTFLRASAGVPIVTIGPGLRTIPHQRDEYVDIADLQKAARLYAAAAIYFLDESHEI